jgi:starch phosphorylase
MKASMNGVLHLSIADGWWDEGHTGSNGWVIEGTPVSADQADVDAADAEGLYRLLEDQVAPTFYTRDSKDLPRQWIAMIKQAILTVTPRFSTRRMLKDYATRAYAPALRTGTPSTTGTSGTR